ncbi:MAG: GNAT family N-acetyltransferase [Chloracidobacterium sp.]|nr:GNAT family N-acetyltransferase [Chloracidobacterium sp.]
MGDIELLPAIEEDDAFLSQLYRLGRQAEVACFGWDEEQQSAFLDMQFRARQQAYKIQFPKTEYSIVTVDQNSAGCLTVERSADQIRIVDIAILPDYRGRGIATHLIEQLQTESAASARPLVLRVDVTNIKAKELYEKHGFFVSTETQIYYEMAWGISAECRMSDRHKIGSLAGDPNVILRSVNEADREFLLQVYTVSREAELSMTPWDDGQKRAFAAHQLDAQTYTYSVKYPDATHDIILYDGKPAGRLYVDRGIEQIAILDITVLPEYREKGIGTELVSNLQNEAAATNRSVRIYLEQINPSQKLFRTLGFEVVPDDGIDLRFEWKGEPTI